MKVAATIQSRRLLLLLLALCCGLAAIIFVEVTAPPPPVPAALVPPATIAANPADARSASFSLPPLTAYAEVAQRPLFSETRRPAPESADSDPAAANFSLVGTIISGGDRRALVAHGQPPRTERLVEGQSVDGWTVESILDDRVVLRRVDTRLEVKVKNQPNSPSPQGTFQQIPTGLVRAAPQSNLPGSIVNRAPGLPPAAGGGK